MWNGLSLAVVLPTYNEPLSIRECIEQFEELGVVDRVLVVNNNAHPDTSARVATTSAVEVHEPIQGYGAAIRRGLAETAEFDLVCVCEPDGTFVPGDLLKLLPYTADVDVVLGSRTVQTFIFSGANMGRFLRYGNWAVAKLAEVLFDTVSLSDVGCTFRVISRKAIDTMSPSFRSIGSDFGFEIMLIAAAMRIPMVQIPVRYQARVGQSSVTGNRWVAVKLGLSMIALCVRSRVSIRKRVSTAGDTSD